MDNDSEAEVNEKINNLLEKVFANVNSWLNFGEAKNAANIALVVACIAALSGFENKCCLVHLCMFLIVISGIISLVSFYPKTSKNDDKNNNATFDENYDLLLYSDIGKCSTNKYMEQICKLYLEYDKKDFNRYQIDLSNEIISNAKIANWKFKLFKWAVSFDIIAFIIF